MCLGMAFDLIYRKRSSHPADSPLLGLKLLVIGSTLGGYVIDMPRSVLDDFIVVISQRTRRRLQYGYRALPYNGEDNASWDGDTDMVPVYAFWNIVDCLVDLRMTKVMSMIGMSAGVDRCLALLGHVGDAQPRHHVVCSHFVAICGAFHSFLYDLVQDVFTSHRSRIIVVHHEDDTLCLWPPVALSC